MSLALLIAGIAAATATLLATVRVRHPSALSVVVMAIGWLTGELALVHLALQVIVTAVLIAFGALDQTSGWIGLAAMVASWIGLVRVQLIAHRARPVLADVVEPFSTEAAERIRSGAADRATLRRPFRFDKTGIEVVRDIAYGTDDAQRLDLYRPSHVDGAAEAPVMVYIHGGAWVSGKKEQQGLAMMHAFARAGWVCVGVDYRLGKQHRFPAHIEDITTVLEWVHANIAEHGGDPSFVAVSGNSAGGHLASLAALDPASRHLVNACIPVYGAFDFTDHLDIRGYARMRPFLERMVMPMKQADDNEFWEQMSPIHRVTENAPPFLVIYAVLDVFVWREEAQAFVERLAAVSSSAVLSAGLPGAHHAFDIFNSVRCAAAADATLAFCEAARTQQTSNV